MTFPSEQRRCVYSSCSIREGLTQYESNPPGYRPNWSPVRRWVCSVHAPHLGVKAQ